MTLHRRDFIKRGAAVTAATSVAGLLATQGPAGAFPAGGYGVLVADPLGVLDLPPGFSYKQIALRGTTTLADGTAVPGDADGMGAFLDTSTGNTILVCNHEISTSESAKAVPKLNGAAPVPTYDAACFGGTTTLVLDSNANVLSHTASIAGTTNNCAGGVTPWGTWLTCEESESPVGTTPHGYVFEVDPKGVLTTALPYKAMGRFNHEASAIDPLTSEVYETEDQTTGLLYKFVPTDTSMQFGSLGNGGTLYAMKVPGFANFAEITALNTPIGGITWTATPNPGSVAVPQDTTGLRNLFPNTDVTRGQKLEGCWWADGKLWFVSSYNHGAVPALLHEGQFFVYDPIANTLTQLARFAAGGQPASGSSSSGEVFANPDNVVVSPYGGAIWCEDGDDPNYLGGIQSDGTFFPIGKNRGSGEFAGACFSHDGKWMFVSMQTQHRTLAITGPWTGAPTPVVPEVPFGVLLPLTGAAALGAGVLALRNHGQRVQPTVG